jgi:hypothetical protein
MPKRERDTTSSTSHSHLLSRRDFVARTSLIGAGLVIGPLSWTGCSNQSSGVSSSADTGSVRGLNKMNTRQLGTLTVSEIGAGAMSISANYGPPADRGEGIKVLREAHHRGVTFFDTAEVYGPYTSEALVGEALAPVRDSVRIATKRAHAPADSVDRPQPEIRGRFRTTVRSARVDNPHADGADEIRSTR